MVRGLELRRRSPQFEGRFGRMFRSLPAAKFEDSMLVALAEQMTAQQEPDTEEDQFDDEENPGISAGYTYFGQFIDHDLTFDPVSSLQRQDDPDALVDYRTPRFDLDNVYGRGPDDQPYLYRQDGIHMRLGDRLTGNDDDPNARAVPRVKGESGEPDRAVIGDPRNDENAIVSQLQASFLRFHNRMADELGSTDFEDVQRLVRWHYQWIILHDFLPTVCGADTVNKIMGEIQTGGTGTAKPPQLEFYKIEKRAYIPLEFSVAAYRFGHSMVRSIYRLNRTTRLPIFSLSSASLMGFRAFPSDWAIDWRLFFKGDAGVPLTGPARVQPAYKIDTSLVNPLKTLPPSVAANPSSLPLRNLRRGCSLQLPSGQAVSRAMKVRPLDDDLLRIGKANEDGMKSNKPLAELDKRFRNNAPLWFYILSEAQQQFKDNSTPIHLGPVGGTIVAETMVGLMLADSHSYLRQDPLFEPLRQFRSSDGKFGVAELLNAAKSV